VYSVISVIVDSLPGNTKNRELTRSWTAISPWTRRTTRFKTPWADFAVIGGHSVQL